MAIMEPSDCDNCQIRSIALFGELDPETLARLQTQAYQFEASAGSVIFEANQPAEASYTLREGVIKLVRTQQDGRTQIVRLLVGGDFFGAEGLFEEPHRHTAVALTPVRLCRLPNTLLQQLRREDPTFSEALLGRWRRALDEVETLALELGTQKAEQRIASFLLHWQGKLGVDSGWLPLPLSRSELGELLGLRVETVSRVMARWKRQGVLNEKAGSIRLQDAESLRRTLQPVPG